jgi:hypothetical protein
MSLSPDERQCDDERPERLRASEESLAEADYMTASKLNRQPAEQNE